MIATLRKCPVAGTREINSKHSRLSGSWTKAKLSSHPLRKKKKGQYKPKLPPPYKMLNIPNCCRNANQKDDGKLNPTTPNGQQLIWDGVWGTKNCSKLSVGIYISSSQYHGQSPNAWKKKKQSSPTKLRIRHSPTLACILRKPSIQRHKHPNKPPARLPVVEIHNHKISNKKLKLKQEVYIYTADYFSLIKNHHWN